MPAPDLSQQPSAHAERHFVTRTGWLRAAVLGANDGLVSTASLMVGVAAASVSAGQLVLTGFAGIAAGAMSMAAGEYVSVSSQADSERADLARESAALVDTPEEEHAELAAIYEQRGLDPDLAAKVATGLMAHDPLDAHARDEMGISAAVAARPLQAAGASAAAFVVGGLPPLLVALLLPGAQVIYWMVGVTLAALGLLGVASARLGGAPAGRAVVRVVVFGGLAMAVTALVGRLFEIAV
ncbi:MAG: VIT1/CCC1 transporter family protein [Tsuneonella troitsensis]